MEPKEEVVNTTKFVVFVDDNSDYRLVKLEDIQNRYSSKIKEFDLDRQFLSNKCDFTVFKKESLILETGNLLLLEGCILKLEGDFRECFNIKIETLDNPILVSYPKDLELLNSTFSGKVVLNDFRKKIVEVKLDSPVLIFGKKYKTITFGYGYYNQDLLVGIEVNNISLSKDIIYLKDELPAREKDLNEMISKKDLIYLAVLKNLVKWLKYIGIFTFILIVFLNLCSLRLSIFLGDSILLNIFSFILSICFILPIIFEIKEIISKYNERYKKNYLEFPLRLVSFSIYSIFAVISLYLYTFVFVFSPTIYDAKREIIMETGIVKIHSIYDLLNPDELAKRYIKIYTVHKISFELKNVIFSKLKLKEKFMLDFDINFKPSIKLLDVKSKLNIAKLQVQEVLNSSHFNMDTVENLASKRKFLDLGEIFINSLIEQGLSKDDISYFEIKNRVAELK